MSPRQTNQGAWKGVRQGQSETETGRTMEHGGSLFSSPLDSRGMPVCKYLDLRWIGRPGAIWATEGSCMSNVERSTGGEVVLELSSCEHPRCTEPAGVSDSCPAGCGLEGVGWQCQGLLASRYFPPLANSRPKITPRPYLYMCGSGVPSLTFKGETCLADSGGADPELRPVISFNSHRGLELPQ